jgi:hypothetical protein
LEETQPNTIGEQEERLGAMEVHLKDEVEHVAYVVLEAVKSVMSNALLSRAHACGDGRGPELWRKLHAEWKGSAPEIVEAKGRRYQDPARCRNIQQLWEAIPTW